LPFASATTACPFQVIEAADHGRSCAGIGQAAIDKECILDRGEGARMQPFDIALGTPPMVRLTMK
jgi:hypothetical protein